MKKTYLHIDTEIEVKYTTTLGDTGNFKEEDINEIAEKHLINWAGENGIDLGYISIKKISKY